MASDSKNVKTTKLLLVDDTPANLVALEAVLQNPDYQLVTAASGFEAIERIRENDFALIILDVQMPGIDGYETSRRIKQLDRAKEVPIIFVTAVYTDDPNVRRGYEAGAIDYFGKPFDPDVLKAKVNIYANLYKRTHEIEEHKRKLIEAEAQLKMERKLRTILDGINEGIIVANAAGKIVQTNDEAKRIWGDVKFVEIDRFDEYIGWRDGTGERLKADDWAMARALRKGEICHNERIRIQCFDGAQKTILNSASPLFGARGEIVGAVAILQDISHQVQIEEELKLRIEELTQSNVDLKRVS
jgi:DNA-binding response OmpR family regulator